MGFELLANQIAVDKGIDPRKVRIDFLNTINSKIAHIEKRGLIKGKKYGDSDDWILVTNKRENLFLIIHDILEHNTGYVQYEKIPLEIAIGSGQYDKWATLEGENLIVEEETIKFLKSRIIDYYRQYIYNNQGKTLKSSFIIMTKSVFNELELLDKKICADITYSSKINDVAKDITFYNVDVDKFRKRGGTLYFLDQIGLLGTRIYDRIDSLYVKPIEYDEINKVLLKKRIVFITGAAEYGKTYTAIRFLWEYYERGFIPNWIRGGEPTERIEVRKQLEDFNPEPLKNHIIYFEDPFGKTKYEKRENLEREIGAILECVENCADVYIIITSREEVFKEFEKEKLSAKDLKEFEMKLNIKTPSYNTEERKEILFKWAEREECRWLQYQHLNNLVKNRMIDKKILSTPLSIRDFCISTVDIDTAEKLNEKILEKSKETEIAFANEIINMTEDKILFLSFPFISQNFEIDFIREQYNMLIRKLGIKNAWIFDKVLDWFQQDKITTSEIVYGEELYSQIYIAFSHPSYSRAFTHLLAKDGYLTEINERIFSPVLIALLNEEVSKGDVVKFIIENYNVLNNSVKNILFDIYEDSDCVHIVAKSIVENYKLLPQKVNDLLINLSKNNEFAWSVANAVIIGFLDLPPNERNRILINLSRQDSAAPILVRNIRKNIDYIPNDVINQVFLNISEKNIDSTNLGHLVHIYFNRFPKNLRKKLLINLLNHPESTEMVVWILRNKFESFPRTFRENLLIKLSERNEAVRDITHIILTEFEEIPSNIEEVLYSLTKLEGVSDDIALVLDEKFDSLPIKPRNKLLKITSNDCSAHQTLGWILFRNFEALPIELREEILTKISRSPKATWPVTRTLIKYYDLLPKRFHSLFKYFLKTEETRHDAERMIGEYLYELPKDAQINIQKELNK